MNTTRKIWQLLEDENFQDDVLSAVSSCSSELEYTIPDKYSITEQEFQYARMLLSGLSFKPKKVLDTEINYAFRRLQKKIGKSVDFNANDNHKTKPLVWMTRIAAVLSIPLLVSTVYLYIQKPRQVTAPVESKALVFNLFKAPLGAKTQVVLPDGSLVWLNSGSSLSFPSRFATDSRDVELRGEAYFEVVKDEHIPLIVSTGDMKVKVYGTKFNVNAYADEQTIETTLVEGKVSIMHGHSPREIKLDPGYTATFEMNSHKLNIRKVTDMDAYTGWKDGKLLFRNERFASIVKELERWYNIDIQIADSSLNDYSLYATFIDENVEQVLDIFSNSIPIAIECPKRAVLPNGLYSKRVIVIRNDPDKR